MKNIFRITGKDKFGFVKNYAILLIYVFRFCKTILKALQRTRNETKKCFKVTKISLQSYVMEIVFANLKTTGYLSCKTDRLGMTVQYARVFKAMYRQVSCINKNI